MPEIGAILREGKGKKVYATEDPDQAIVFFKDEAMAFHGLKRGRIMGKGEVNNAVCAHLYKMLAEKGIELKDLPKYPLMMLEEVSNSRRYISRYAEENGVVLNPILEIGSSDLLISFAKINLGLTYAIRELSRELEEKKLYEIPVNPPVPKRSIGMVRLKNVAMSHALQGFIDLMDLPKLKR